MFFSFAIKKYKCIVTTTVICAFIFWANAYAVTNYTQFGRYITVTNAPRGHGSYGLNGTVQRQFPNSIKTVGQAIRYTLQQTEYQLLPASQTSVSVRQMYNKPLPTYLRSIGPMSLKKALLTLSDNVYQLVVDPVHRLITYKVRSEYRTL